MLPKDAHAYRIKIFENKGAAGCKRNCPNNDHVVIKYMPLKLPCVKDNKILKNQN